MTHDRQPLAFAVDLCSYYTAFEVEKVRTVNYILSSSHHDRMRGAMLFFPGVTFCSSKQSRKLYESPIDKQHKYEQNLKRIMRQSLVDVGLSIARLSDLFFNNYIHCELHCYNTADADDLATQRTRSSSAIVLSHLTRNTPKHWFSEKKACLTDLHYNDVIMSAMASQLTSLTIVYSIVYSGADQIKHQSSASLAFVRGIHRWPVNSLHKGPLTRKMFPFDDVIMFIIY